MIDREHVFGLRNEAGEDIAGVRQGRGRGSQLPRRASTAGRAGRWMCREDRGMTLGGSGTSTEGVGWLVG